MTSLKVSVDYAPDQLYKIMLLAQKQLNIPVVFIFNKIASYNRQRLISKRVKFIVLDKLVFIPALMLSLKEIGIAKAREMVVTIVDPVA